MIAGSEYKRKTVDGEPIRQRRSAAELRLYDLCAELRDDTMVSRSETSIFG